jgi:anthranilate phosphoribosyltransferase
MLEALNKKLSDGQSLSVEEMSSSMESIMAGQVPEEDLIEFLQNLRDKGENIEEITAAAKVMRRHALTCLEVPEDLVDTCGTGGDNKGTFNISTAAAFVAAGAGVPIAKHGNRSVSSRSGSADVLEALGVVIDLPPERVVDCIREAGIGFFFARRFHPAMKHVAAARQKIGTRTIFNLLGPLTNPAGATRQIVGVFAQTWCEPLATVLGQLGSKHVMVVHGDDGMDEVTLTGNTHYAECKEGVVTTGQINPEELGLTLCSESDLKGEDAEWNAHLLRGILEGFESPLRQAVLLNAAAALYVAGHAANIHDGLGMAAKSVDQGKALEALKKLIEVSRR